MRTYADKVRTKVEVRVKPRISQRFIAALKPPARGSKIFYDRELSGFGVRITYRGTVSFVLSYYGVRPGAGKKKYKERRITLGRVPVLKADQARELAIELRGGLLRNQDPLDRRRQEFETSRPTVAQLAEEYRIRHAEPYNRASSIRSNKSLLGFILPRLGQVEVTAVERGQIEGLHRQLKTTPYQANRMLALLSKMFSLAVVWGLRSDNPVRGIPRYPEDRRERWLNQEELGRLIEALDQHPNRGGAEAIRMILLTGCRKSEALGARWDEFDLERGVWTKPSHATKQKRIEHVPLSRLACAILQGRKEQVNGGPFLFPGRRAGKHLREISNVWREVCQKAKLKGVRLHDLRHTFASHLVSSGVPLAVVGKLLGHTQPQTTARYAHLADSPVREAANRFELILNGKKKGGRR